MLSKLFGKHAKPDPRYVDIRGHEWGNKSQLEYLKTPDAWPAIAIGGAAATFELMQGQVATAALFFGYSSLSSLGISHLFKTKLVSLTWRDAAGYAIDRHGRTQPPANNADLMFQARFVRLGSVAISGAYVAGYAAVLTLAREKYANLQELAVYASPLATGAMHYGHRSYALSKLLKKEYVFCDKPPAKKKKAESKVASGALVNGI